uniref:PiggyBac transposable element-derived protein domain-containing protein n=1 Tax=Romanomermis culicivorax TaxID=13658 RepID=A0A915HXS4_ROMCU
FGEPNSESKTKTFEQDDFKWTADFFNVKVSKLSSNACILEPGPSPKIKNANLKEPHEIVDCTNEYGRLKSKDFQETNAIEIKAFFAACVFLGLYRSVTIDYVYSNEAAEGFLAISHAFSPQRFEELRCYIYFCKMSQRREKKADKLTKIRFIFESLMKNFQNAFICSRNVSIDEVRPHVRNKICSSYAIKVWALCDVESTYLYNGKMYHGEVGCKAEDDQAIRFAMELIEPAMNCSRTLFTRSFFTSPELAVKLLSKGTFLTGTVRCKVKGIPREIHNEDRDPSKRSTTPFSKFLWCENFPMTLVKFRDATKKCIPVYYLSSWSWNDSATVSHISGNKPNIILSFNRAKNCVDYAHMLAGYSTSNVPTQRWFQRIFYWLLDVTYLNA